MALVPLPAGLPIDIPQCAYWNIFVWMRHRDFARFVGVYKLIVISVGLSPEPSFAFELLYHASRVSEAFPTGPLQFAVLHLSPSALRLGVFWQQFLVVLNAVGCRWLRAADAWFWAFFPGQFCEAEPSAEARDAAWARNAEMFYLRHDDRHHFPVPIGICGIFSMHRDGVRFGYFNIVEHPGFHVSFNGESGFGMDIESRFAARCAVGQVWDAELIVPPPFSGYQHRIVAQFG